MRIPRILSIAVLSAVTLTGASSARDEAHRPAASGDSADVVAVHHQFHAALAAGDSAGALSLLAMDVMILESGSIETLAEYRAHHLPADIEFARSTKETRKIASVTVSGSAAWIVGTSTAEGQRNGRAVNSAGAELMILRKVGDAWKISAIHWSSRRRASGG